MHPVLIWKTKHIFLRKRISLALCNTRLSLFEICLNHTKFEMNKETLSTKLLAGKWQKQGLLNPLNNTGGFLLFFCWVYYTCRNKEQAVPCSLTAPSEAQRRGTVNLIMLQWLGQPVWSVLASNFITSPRSRLPCHRFCLLHLHFCRNNKCHPKSHLHAEIQGILT